MSKINRRGFLKMAGIGAAALAAPTSTFAKKATAERPNIVLVISDDQGWGDLSVHGNKNVRTPNIDSLARDGALFDRFFVSPVCAPTRASLLTGRYHPRTGVFGVTRGQERMNVDEVTVADILKAGGYATGAFGKWHNGSQYPYHPNGRGFDEFYGFCCGHWSNYFDTLLEHNGEEVRSKGFIIDDLTDKAVAFIAANKAGPFFCYVPYNTPHSPFQVPKAYHETLKKRGLTMFNRDKAKDDSAKTTCALAMCENIDWNVGRILKALDKHDLADNTIVIYISDNGPNSWRWNGGMMGKKGSSQEGGVRVPFLIRWPGRIKAGLTIEQITSHIDILPTLADITGLSTARCKPLDGVSLKPLLDGKGDNWPDRMIFTAWRKSTVRTQRYRADARSLYDMQADPGQRSNIARKKPAVHAKLAKALEKFQKDVGLNKRTDRPYPVGHREFPLTVLPAQDCTYTGKGMRYSSRHPNSSWITGWASKDAVISCDIDVATAGRYDVTLLYTCPKADVGAEIELEFKGKTLKGKVTKAYDPPLIDSPDYVERQESYEKPFAPLELGVIELAKGRGKLTLRATAMPGKGVMDLRAIKLCLR